MEDRVCGRDYLAMEKIIKKIERTKKARFEASRRKKRCKIASTTAVAMLSVYIIAINMLGFLDAYKDYNNEIAVISIGLSVFVLVFSLLINLLQYEAQEQNYHSCGTELSRLKDMVSLNRENKDESVKEKFLEQYHSILIKYNLNHDEVDYLRATRNDEKVGKWSKIVRWFCWYIGDSYLVYWLISLVPFFMFLYYCK